MVSARRVQGEVRREAAAKKRAGLSSRPLLLTEAREIPQMALGGEQELFMTHTVASKHAGSGGVTWIPALDPTENLGSTRDAGQQGPRDNPSCVTAPPAGAQDCWGRTAASICSNQAVTIHFQTKELRPAIRELVKLYATT